MIGTSGVGLALALALLAGTGASDARSPNVVGVLIGSPVELVAPACPRDEPCDPPARFARLVFSRSGHADARVFVGANGHFRLRLAHGRYHVRLEPKPAHGRLFPSRLRVPRRGVIHPRFEFR